MTLDKLLSDLAVRVEPFALCMVNKSWRLRLPGPPGVMLHFILKGSGVIDANRNLYPIEPHYLAVVPRGVVHALQPGGEVESEHRIDASPQGKPVHRIVAGPSEEHDLIVACGVVSVRYGQSLGLFDHLREVLVVDLSGTPQVSTAFQGILAEQTQPGPASEAMTAALMTECLVCMFRELTRNRDSSLPWLIALEDERLGRAIDRVLENPGADHTVELLAETAAMSRSAFAERFNTAFGLTPMGLVHHIRMQRACQLLRESRCSIDEVADRVGFSSRSHFSRAFKKHSGIPPAVYRGRQ
jgi:AraC-like DNA-binding protein